MYRADLDSLTFVPVGHDGHCTVHRRALQTLLGVAVTGEDCNRYFHAQRPVLEAAASAKIARAALARASNFHLTSRDLKRCVGAESTDGHAEKMQRRKAIQDRRMAETVTDRGLVIVHTGAGKGKTTAALGMVLRSLGHGFRVGIVQFIKGAWEPAEKKAFEPWGEQLRFHASGAGFTWETQDKVRDQQMAQSGWQVAVELLRDPDYQLVLLDEVNIALKKNYLSIEQVLAGIDLRPPTTHVVLTGRNAPDALIERADLVTEMTLIKHPLKLQRIRAQAGIEF
jgi:cob(I)alamin adenosyltransferase